MDESTERWLPYPGYAGFYEVSTWGNVMSLPRATTRGKLLKAQVNKKGYRQFGLSKYGKVTIKRAARMVLETFDKPCPPGMEACHGPLGKLVDRWPDNLYWGTLSRNHKQDRWRDGTDFRGEHSVRAVLTADIVLECRRRARSEYNPGGETQAALAVEFGVTPEGMGAAIRGDTWAHIPDAVSLNPAQAKGALTDEIVLECRRRVRSKDNLEGETQTALAIEFGVSSGAMSSAINGRTWGHLTEGIPDPAVDGRSLISTPEMRERRREYGRKGAEARWG